MNSKFNAREVFEIAAKIERGGYVFYKRAADMTVKYPEASEFLRKLAGMELEHEERFSKMKDDFSSDLGSLPDAEKQALSYLQAMAEGRIFENHNDPASRLTGRETLEELYLAAMGFEKDSVIFFTGIRELVPDKLGKERVDYLIKEEMCHIAILSRELAAARVNLKK